MRPATASDVRRAKGFSMIEVLVAMLVSAIGLLGFAKLQAAAIANSQGARVQSLIALHAAGLAAAMNANRGFWASAAAPARVTVSDGVVEGAASAPASDCRTVPCTPAQVAADDLRVWASSGQQQFPAYRAAIACTTALPQPPHCVIDVWWAQKVVAINRSTASAPSQARTPTGHYSLYVEP